MLDVIAYGALIKQKRGVAKLTQETLAGDVFGDSTRKSDISRIENGRVEPQEATIQKINAALRITEAEMATIRTARPSAKQLDQIPTLSRNELVLLATLFEIERAFDLPDAELRRLLELKAEEYRAYKAEIDRIDERTKGLGNLKAAAQDAAARLDLEEVENLLSKVHETELEIAAETAELRANNALLRGHVDQAYHLFCTAADSFSAVDPLEPIRRRDRYRKTLYEHGLRYADNGLQRAIDLVRPIATDDLRTLNEQLWGKVQNNLGIVLKEQGLREEGQIGTELLSSSVSAYRAALTVFTLDETPREWALAKNNLGSALRRQCIRMESGTGADLLNEAVVACRCALEVHTRDDMPTHWAMTQNNLGNVLSDQGRRTEGEASANLLAEAVTTFRAASEAYKSENLLEDWAKVQNNLGGALRDQGIRSGGQAVADLFAEAITAYRAALEVRTRKDMPAYWATTQENLALVEEAIAEHDSTDDPRPHLEAALAHVEAALTVYDPELMSYYFEKATRLRDDIQAKLDAL